jgi:hypothetical protein
MTGPRGQDAERAARGIVTGSEYSQNTAMSTDVIRPAHACPACGYAGLDGPSYAALSRLPVPDILEPPYSQHFGTPSYEVCACCGFEFGNDDEPGTAPPVTFRRYREEWIADGSPWFDPSRRPDGWSLERQLAAAGIDMAKGS